MLDNTPLRFAPPAGYHLTEDLIDRAVGLVTDVRTADPDKPFFLYLALGACHAPHQAPPEWIARYRGQFDDGLGRVAGAHPRAADRDGHRAARHDAVAATVVGAGMGVAAGASVARPTPA